MKIKRNGIHIPQEIFELEIDWTAKVLLSEIYHFTKKNICFASNRHFAELLQITKGAASKQITKLEKLNYISTQKKFENGKCVGRIITYRGVTEPKNSEDVNTRHLKESIDDTAYSDKQPAILPHAEAGIPITNESLTQQPNSISSTTSDIIPQQPEDSSPTTSDVIAQQPNGSSSTTSDIVPEQPEGDSSGNTNNTINNTNMNNTYNKKIGIDQLITNVDLLIEQSSYISKNLIQPDQLDQFKVAFQFYSNEDQYPMSTIVNDLTYIFQDYPEWKIDLLDLGYDRFMHTIKTYHEGTPEQIAGLLASFMRIILQHQTL